MTNKNCFPRYDVELSLLKVGDMVNASQSSLIKEDDMDSISEQIVVSFGIMLLGMSLVFVFNDTDFSD